MRNAIIFLFAPLLILAGAEAAGASRSAVEPLRGIARNTPSVEAFRGGRIVTAPGRPPVEGVLVVRDGIIAAVGPDAAIPPDAAVHDVSGMMIYPGLIDLGASFGLADDAADTVGAHHWNSAVRPDRRAAALFRGDPVREKAYRRAGFTSVLVTPRKGIFKGESVLLSLADRAVAKRIIPSRAIQGIDFHPLAGDHYPSSLMGVIALERQTFLDARWYRDERAKHPEETEENLALDALLPVLSGDATLLWEVDDEWGALRAARIAREADVTCVILGSGYEYRRLDAVRNLNLPFVVPLDFPKPKGESLRRDPLASADEGYWISLRELRHMALGPENPARLVEAGVEIALTPGDSAAIDHFRENLAEAIDRGLSPENALAALTTVPARLAGVGAARGALRVGYAADFLVVEGDLFDPEAKIRESWIGGKCHVIDEVQPIRPGDKWKWMLADGDSIEIRFEGKEPNVSARISRGDSTVSLKEIDRVGGSLSGAFDGTPLGFDRFVRLDAALFPEGPQGRLTLADDTPLEWKGTLVREGDKKKKDEKKEPPLPSLPDIYPSGAFGREALPERPDVVLVRHATIWTSANDGILEDADLLVRKGRIERVGRGIEPPRGAVVIDGTGKHVTAGLIDCHSHTGIAGAVNEGTEAVTAEVRVSDVIDPDRIELYRQLSGGLTVINQLHGSANPIGGQSSVIKLRWGALDEEMKLRTAAPGIKFALGENVKQSNWGDKYKTRYPQTRMGVEQIMEDRFRQALDYREAKKLARSDPSRFRRPRPDLELDALLEVLDGTRKVHCHAYRQDEILMLIRLADRLGFTIGAFQHVLEGYKVADAIAAHGAGASTFSDWWAYKIEVADAIPYNGTLMHDAGVVVSFNSDSHELARRLNMEAAKAVKYGHLSPAEAVKFVTINPAIQLGIDDRVGSLEPGKDADFVVWSGPPLSTATKCEQTWIDGRRYFDAGEDARLREVAEAERNALVQYFLSREEKKSGDDETPEKKEEMR